MVQQWRLVFLAALLLILWVSEAIIPLRRNNRDHVFTNFGFTLTVVIINSLLVFLLVRTIEFCNANHVGIFHYLEVPYLVQVVLGVFVLDFIAAYLSHRVMHKFGIFWKFHQVHHLDEMVDVTTGLRHHPLETFFRFFFLIAGVIILGAPLSIVVIYQTLSAINALFEHSNIKLNARVESVMRNLIVTPDVHKIHHSSDQKFTDSNYGNIFSLWDRLFKTYQKTDETEKLTYGLETNSENKKKGFLSLMLLPFLKS
jgi:sterol desaturase/sphingolipid hydroxylase (fatty acid hydroxylase superfamily)